MDDRRRNARTQFYWRFAAGVLTTIVFGIGCGPGTMLTYFMMKFGDDKIPPAYELKTSKKEVTVVLNTFFAGLQVRPELQTADSDLNKRIAHHLYARFKANKEGIKIVDDAKLRASYKQASNPLFNPTEIGKECDADYVINIEINSLTLRKEKSFDQFFEGNAEISIHVTKMEDGSDWEKDYRASYPETGPVYVTDISPRKFRADFFEHMARDISRFFAPYPREERMSMRE